MTKGEIKNADKLQACLVVYKSYLDYKIHEGELVWSRFSGFVVMHSIFYAVIGQIIVTSPLLNKSYFLIIISILGLLLGGLWYLSTVRGFESVEFWSNAAMEYANYIRKKFDIHHVFEKGEEYFKLDQEVEFQLGHYNNLPMQRSKITRTVPINTRGTAYISILLIQLSYFVLLFVTLLGWIE